MTLTNTLRIAGLSTLILAFAGIAAAQGPVADSPTTSAELEMSAEVQTALQLNISTGVGGATVTGSNATGLFAINFGIVNGLGLGTPTAGVTASIDGTGTTYTTPINLTPVYSGFTTETADVTVEEGASADQPIAREGATAGGVVAVTTPVAVFSSAASESLNERFVGFRIARTEAAGAKVATLIYTVTMAID
ncbi:MAG: hypothetical protein AB7J13_05105 [Pyrinomonadaceae bacterium]